MNLLTNLLFVSIIISGSVYGAVWFERRFEETIAVSVMSMVVLLFISGLMGDLRIGMVSIYIVAITLYVLSVARLSKTRKIRCFIQNIFTPGSALFFACCIAFSVWNYGKLASSWDEFSHWMDIVKVASSINDFGTNPAANSMFQSYPPSMMLFQYSLQKLYQLVKPGALFSEWRVYYSYQIFILALFMPFFRNITFRQPIRMILYVVIALLAPLLFFSNLYSSVYIDPFVGILFGTGMAMIVVRPKQDRLYEVHIWLLCVVLTLSKDVGLLFSMAIALSVSILSVLDSTKEKKTKRFLNIIVSFLSAYLPKLMWDWEVRTAGAAISFGGKIDWEILLRVLFGKDDSYRTQVLSSYRDALYDMSISMENLFVRFNYFGWFVLMVVALYLIYRMYVYIYGTDGKEKCRSMGIVSWMSALTLTGYIMGLCVIYMFKFSEYEAIRLASMTRYLNIAFVGIWILLLLLLADGISVWKFYKEAEMVLLLLTLLSVPTREFGLFIRGFHINNSAWIRGPFKEMENSIHEVCDGDDRIYFIAQETGGFEYWVCRYVARPNAFNENFTWSIGEPFYEGDVWSQKMDVQDWSEILFERYDYVALYKINDYFVQHFGSLFENVEEIENNALYRVNREMGKLEKYSN